MQRWVMDIGAFLLLKHALYGTGQFLRLFHHPWWQADTPCQSLVRLCVSMVNVFCMNGLKIWSLQNTFKYKEQNDFFGYFGLFLILMGVSSCASLHRNLSIYYEWLGLWNDGGVCRFVNEIRKWRIQDTKRRTTDYFVYVHGLASIFLPGRRMWQI